MKARLFGLLFLLAALPVDGLAQGLRQRRLALVIGNAAYGEKALATAGNDAEDVGALLRKLRFETSIYKDVKYSEFRWVVGKFADSLQPGDTVLFYYAGHGMEVEGKNYLPPIDFDFLSTREAEVSDKAVSTNNILMQIRKKKPRNLIFILDACRNNPIRGNRSGAGGLAELNGDRGEYIAFATAPGKTASDVSSGGRNGLFTKYFLTAASAPRRTINDVFDEVRAHVDQESGGKQTPWSNSGLIGTFYFNPDGVPVATMARSGAPAGPVSKTAVRSGCPAKADPPSGEGEWVQRAECALSQGNAATALQYLNQAVKLNGGNAEYYLLRARAHGELRQFKLVEADLRKGMELAPDDPRFPLELGRWQMTQGNYSEALSSLQSAYEMDPKDEACRLLADALDHVGQSSSGRDLRAKCMR